MGILTQQQMNELVGAVRRHALCNYSRQGWDYVVEAWDDADIAQTIAHADAENDDEAVAAVLADITPLYDYEQDIRGHGGLND